MLIDIGPLGPIAFATVAALAAETVAYLYIYRTSSFRTLKTNLEKHGNKVEVAKDGSSAKGVKKKEVRLAGWEEATSKQIASVQFKTGLIVSFGGCCPLSGLPFCPFSGMPPPPP